MLLWLRSVTVSDDLTWSRNETRTSFRNESYEELKVFSSGGGLSVFFNRLRVLPPAGPFPMTPWKLRWQAQPRKPGPARVFLSRLQFESQTTTYATYLGREIGRVQQVNSGTVAVVPHGVVALVLATPPSLWWGIPVLRRRWRARRGLCVRCGYDLRGSKDKCPECGTPFTMAPAVKSRAPGGSP